MNGDNGRPWCELVGIQRKTLFSNSIMIETDDSRRISELLDSRPAVAVVESKKNEQKWLILDGWEGFSEFKEVKNEITGKKEWGKIPIKGGNVDQYGIRQVLPLVSKELYNEKGKVVLVITNVFKTDDLINSALRGWSTSEKLRELDSTVIIFADDRCTYPSEVWTHMKIIKPPKSIWKEREDMLNLQQKELKPKKILDKIQINDAVRLTAGMNLDQLEAATIESIILKNAVDIDVLAKSKVETVAKDPVVDIIEQPKFGFEAVGGYNSLKQRLVDDIVLPLRNPEFAKRYCMQPPRGIILYGPPGTGKTLLVKAMAKELNMSILVLRMENVLGKYVGDSEKSLRKAFDIADAMAPCIVFVDEIDRFSKRGTGADNISAHVERELFSMLLEKLGDENRKWFFAAATNIIDAIDPALRRTGRIDSVAPVPYPDEKAREEIFKIHTQIKRKLPMKKDVDAKEIARLTYMWSGSDIEQLVIRTSSFVMKKDIKDEEHDLEITRGDFLDMYETFNIPISKNEEQQQIVKDKVLEFTNDKRLMDVFEQAEKVNVEVLSRTEKAKSMPKGIDK